MTDRQNRFVAEYLIDLNATQAAIRAGYSPRSAQEQGSELLSNPIVRARVDEALADRSKRTGVTQDRVIRELARVAFLDPIKLADFDTAGIDPSAAEDDRAAISSVKVKSGADFTEREIRFVDKIKALDLLGRHLGMWDKNGARDGGNEATGVVELPSVLPEVDAHGAD